jgi:hypothetical protein
MKVKRFRYITSLFVSDSPEDIIDIIKSNTTFSLVKKTDKENALTFQLIGPFSFVKEHNFEYVSGSIKKRAIDLGIHNSALVTKVARDIHLAQTAEKIINEGKKLIKFRVNKKNTQIIIVLDILTKYVQELEECIDYYAFIYISSFVESMGLLLQKEIKKQFINN